VRVRFAVKNAMEENKMPCWKMGTSARLAQMVERRPYKANVGSSILSSRTILIEENFNDVGKMVFYSNLV
jgi:hypothetical protein